jgi:DNA-binding NarL/FixJ family response regulator
VRTAPEARRLLKRLEPFGALIELAFDAGHGVAFAFKFRQSYPLLPVLVVGEQFSASDLVTLHRARILAGTARLGEYEIHRFVESAYRASIPTVDVLDECVEMFSKLHQLTEQEARIVRAMASGSDLGKMARSFGISPNTLKSQARTLLKKTGLNSLRAVSRVVLTDVVGSRDASAALPELLPL